MKGLILKDLYMMRKYNMSFLLIFAVFMVVSFFGGENSFFTVYPVLLAGILPVNLIAYDEKSKWMSYAVVFPYSRRQIVTVKYIITAVVYAVILLFTFAVQWLKAAVYGGDISDNVSIISVLAPVGIMPSAVMLPLIFKLGVEKGRIVYILGICIICALIPMFTMSEDISIDIGAAQLMIIIIPILLFIFSWFVSVRVFEKREL